MEVGVIWFVKCLVKQAKRYDFILVIRPETVSKWLCY